MITAFRALVRKDLRLFFSDRRAVMMSIAAPILIGSFFGFVFGGQSGKSETSRIPVAVIDNDAGTISRGIIERLGADKSIEVRASTLEKARTDVQKGKVTVAILIPKGFGDEAGRALFRPEAKPEISLLYDPSHNVERSMVQGILTGEVMRVVSKEVFGGQTGARVLDETIPQIEGTTALDPTQKKVLLDMLHSARSLNRQTATAGQADGQGFGMSVPYDVKEEAITSGTGIKYNGYAHAFGGMGVQFILFVGIDVGVGLLMQRQRGLWKRLRAAPLSRTLLLGSRAVSAAITSMMVLMIIFGFARAAFGVRIEGSMTGFLGVCGAFSLMTAAFGLLIAALGKTPEATRGLAILVTLLMVMLGGSWVPTFIFPQWLQTLTLVVPTRWAVDGLDAMTWRGLGFSAAIGPIVVLLFSTLVFGVLAVMRFKWEEQG